MVDREKGSNSLRGGKNIYSARSKLGNWVEEEYKPGIPTRGFSTRRFVTTSATQQLEGAGRSVAESEAFGAGVEAAEPRDRFDYADIIHPDTTQHPGVWSSVTKSMHKGPDDAAPTEFSTTFKLKVTNSIRLRLLGGRVEPALALLPTCVNASLERATPTHSPRVLHLPPSTTHRAASRTARISKSTAKSGPAIRHLERPCASKRRKTPRLRKSRRGSSNPKRCGSSRARRSQWSGFANGQ